MTEKNLAKKVSDNAKSQIMQMPYKRRKVKTADQLKEDQVIDRKIVTGMIVNDDFCKWAVHEFDVKNLQAPEIKKVGFWIKEYFDEYQVSPKDDIQTIYMEKLKNNQIYKAEGEFIERFLDSISQEYSENGFFNVEYYKKIALREKVRNRGMERARDILALGENNQLEDMLECFNFQPSFSTKKLTIPTIGDIEARGIEKPKMILSPWLRAGQSNFIYGLPGCGKSLISLLLGYVLGCENYQEADCEINQMQVKEPCGCLYIDGEMGQAECLDRIQKFKWLGLQIPDYEMRIFSLPDEQLRQERSFDLSKRTHQKEIINWLKINPNYKFLVVDSVSTVFNLENENDNSEWNGKINPFLKDLRALGVASLIQHHCGKDGKLRGASAMTNMANNIFCITNHPSKQIGQAWFRFGNDEKQRAAGNQLNPFYMKFINDEDSTLWEITEGGGKDASEDNEKKKGIMVEIIKGTSNKQIAEEYGCKPSYVSKLKTTVKQFKYLDNRNNVTQAGRQFLNEFLEENPG